MGGSVRRWSHRRIRRSRSTPFQAGAGITSARPAGLGFPDTSVTERSRTLRARWGARVRGPARRSSADDIFPDCTGGYVARMIVEVMLKPEIHDPQGEAIASACRRLGFGQVLGVRQGKRFEVELDGPADQAAVTALARDLLSNPVIEEFTVRAG